MILIERRFFKSRSLSRTEKITAWNIFGCNDGYSWMLGKVVVIHTLQKHFMVLGSIKCLRHRINVHSFTPFLK
jgi:hypothetical protein